MTTKVYVSEIFAMWDFYNYKLYTNKEDAQKNADAYNDLLEEKCKKDKCCFARVKEKEIQ